MPDAELSNPDDVASISEWGHSGDPRTEELEKVAEWSLAIEPDVGAEALRRDAWA